MVGHDDSGVRTGRIADIKDGAGKFPGQVLPWQAQGGKRKQEAQGRNSRKQLRSSRQSSAVQVRIQHGNKSPFHIRWAGNGECDRPPAVRVPECAREVDGMEDASRLWSNRTEREIPSALQCETSCPQSPPVIGVA